MLKKASSKKTVALTGLGFIFLAMMTTAALTTTVNAAVVAPVEKYGFGVAIFKDEDPWGYPSNEMVLKMYGIPYDVYNSSYMGNVSLSKYAKVIIASVQTQDFYDAVNASRAWFEDYVENGGVLEIHAAHYTGTGWIGLLPGGINYTQSTSDDVVIATRTHPVVRTPNNITDSELDNWGWSVHGYFTSYPSGSITVLRLGVSPYSPVYLEVPYGSGVIIASSQTLEYAYRYEYSFILENSLLYLAPYEKLDITAKVGTVHFRGEIAEFYVETSLYGNAINASIWEADLYYDGGTEQVNLTANVEIVTVGLYRISYNIPSDAATGTYVLSVKASFRTGMVTATGCATASFIISPTLTSQDGYITDIKDGIATIVIPNLDPIEANLTQINAKVTSIEGDTATIETDIGTVKTSVENVGDLISGIDETTKPTYWFSLAATILAALAAVIAVVIIILVKRKPTP